MITYRKATIDDVAFIASTVLAGVGRECWDGQAEDEENLELHAKIRDLVCSAEDTLYSYRNATIAESDGVPAACIISYSGNGYQKMRLNVAKRMDWTDVPDSFGTEALPGEYYLDTLAAHPNFRGTGIGAMLLEKVCREHKDENTCLLVDAKHEKVIKLYESQGFRRTDTKVNLFGIVHIKMVYQREFR